MEVVSTAIPDVKIVKPKTFGDSRGFFLETWNRRDFADHGLNAEFVQDNYSRSSRGSLRGLHYQIQHTQAKLIRAVIGSIFDVIVDLRRSSRTFGQWVGIELSEDNKHSVWIPEGFAHGFLVTSDVAGVQYKCTDFYAPAYERTLRWDDASLAIDWPLPDGQAPVLSSKDAAGTAFRDAEVFP